MSGTITHLQRNKGQGATVAASVRGAYALTRLTEVVEGRRLYATITSNTNKTAGTMAILAR